VLGLAGIDLVLPAVPALPGHLGGTLTQAQAVLAAFAAGTGLGLLLFGELGTRIPVPALLAGAMVTYALTSLAAALAPSLPALIVLRFLQGTAAACAAVVTPAVVRALFDEAGVLRTLGILSSIEALVPAVAPVLGVGLLHFGGWRASFWVTGGLALGLSILVYILRGAFPPSPPRRSASGYARLLRSGDFQCYALSQGFALASLLVFVFAMPTVFVIALKGTIRDFIVMQITGIVCFIVAANLSGALAGRYGATRVILFGSTLALFGGVFMAAYALGEGSAAWVIWILFIPMNMGFGFRGPPGFVAALRASRGDDARASALIVFYVMLITALGTAILAPFLAAGLAPAAGASVALAVAALLTLILGVVRERPSRAAAD